MNTVKLLFIEKYNIYVIYIIKYHVYNGGFLFTLEKIFSKLIKERKKKGKIIIEQTMRNYTSYRFGAGRYIQEPDILECAGREIQRFGQKPYVISGPTAWNVVKEQFEVGLTEVALDAVLEIYEGFPSHSKIAACKQAITENGCDVFVGIGGGRIMDLAKAVAADLQIPVVLIPTSAATCASFSPLSVIYTDEGKCVGYLHYDYEVNAVLVDERVMACQPPRLLASGIMDAMAKYIEISNGKPEITLETDTVDKYSAYTMAGFMYNVLEEYGWEAYQDVEQQKLTKTVHDVVFCSIALTGIVSALMRAKKQTAVAHRMYEIIRTHYFQESIAYLHGEIVATGLIAQLKYNQNEAAIPRLKSYMEQMKMPMNLAQLGLNCNEDTMQNLYEQLKKSDSVEDTEDSYQRLWEALQMIG
jgi:glycerol dehydrogenase-like iron-containing ADH family enzyme